MGIGDYILKHMSEPTETTLEVRGRKVAARVWGQASAPPVLAMHGWLDNAVSFDALAPLLPELRLVAVDLPGHGLSDHHPPGAPYHYVDWITDVTAIVDALGWDRFSIMGHSMGAGIACLFAGTFPKRVERLVLLDGLGPLTEEPDNAPERLASGIRRLLMTDDKTLKPLPDREFAAKKMCEVVPGLTLASARLLLARGMKDVPGGVVWRADPRLRVPSLFRLTQPHVYAFLRRIACPVLLVWGQDGYRFERSWVQGQLDCLANAKVVGLRGGHHVHLDDAASVAPHVREHFALG
jgi:pimeloyl-ACP methyl ester carboxylesterase